MFKYTPKNPNIKKMKAHNHMITEEGLESPTKIPELDALVNSNILECHEDNTQKLKDKAEKEAAEAKAAQKKADKLAEEAKKAQEEADKEQAEAVEAKEELEEAKPKTRRRRRKPQADK